MTLPSYVLRRLVGMLPLVVLFSILVFGLIHLTPGDPTLFFLPVDRNDPVVRERIVHQLGLDQPLPVQYLRWVSAVAQGDLGFSWNYGVPVREIVGDRFGNSAQLWLTSVVFSLALAVPIGIWSAVRRDSLFDHGATLVTILGISLPDFWFALMLLLVFALFLGWLPTSGNASDLTLFERVPHFVLPTLVLSLQLLPFYARFLRTSLYEVLLKEYVMTARAKGLPGRLVITRHALRNALLPMVTIVGFSIPRLVGAAVIVESIFAWPGVGRLALDAALRRDYPTIMGVTMATFLFVILTNLLVDVLYVVLDPRISFGRRAH